MPGKSDIIIEELYKLLSKYSVEYLIVGGLAVQTYGYSRISTGPGGLPVAKQDIDIWFNPTLANYYSILDVLSDLGLDVEELRQGIANPQKSFLRHEFKNFKVDFLPVMIALPDFRSAYKERRIARFNNLSIPIISYDDLIKNKQAMSRVKDIEDIRQLRLKNNPPQNPDLSDKK